MIVDVNSDIHNQHKRNFLESITLEGVIDVLQAFRGERDYYKKLALHALVDLAAMGVPIDEIPGIEIETLLEVSIMLERGEGYS